MAGSVSAVLVNLLAITAISGSIDPHFEPKKIKSLTTAKAANSTASIVQRDALGVERSYIAFTRRPQLHVHVRRDLFWRDRKLVTRVQRAMEMLRHDMEQNSILMMSWTIGLIRRPYLYADPAKLATYVYSMSEPFYLFSFFNRAVSVFNEDSNYNDFHYKGFYALLLLSSRPFKQDLYRGASTIIEAEKDMFIRFNRFISTSANLTTAMMYATRRATPGTLIVFKGIKDATRIENKNAIPHQDEYLIEPDTQFRVSQVVDGPVSDTNPGRMIVLTRAFYPSALPSISSE